MKTNTMKNQLFKKIIAKNFPELRHIGIQIQESLSVPRKLDAGRKILRQGQNIESSKIQKSTYIERKFHKIDSR